MSEWLVGQMTELEKKQSEMRQRQLNQRYAGVPKQNAGTPALPVKRRPAKPPKSIVRIPGGCPWGHGPEHKNTWGHCLMCSRERYHEEPAARRRQADAVKRRRAARTAEGILAQLKQNARKRGQEFRLVPADILPLPTHCPVFGFELSYGGKSCSDSLASVDRRDSKIGYLPGNVAIISYKANRLKGEATVDEIRQLLAWMEKKCT